MRKNCISVINNSNGNSNACRMRRKDTTASSDGSEKSPSAEAGSSSGDEITLKVFSNLPDRKMVRDW